MLAHGMSSCRTACWERLRFRFDAKLRTLEDLWLRIIPDLSFLKLYYRKPRVGDPTATHYLDCDLFVPDPNWLASHVLVSTHHFAVRHMHTAFPAELGPSPV